MPTVQGTIYRADGSPVTAAQRMRWYKQGTLIKDFQSADNGDYSTVLSAAGYYVVIGLYEANPANYSVTTVPLQTQDFKRTSIPASP
ncbi:MAG: hypothetical protein FJX75_25520 [Armatimonadetes bacterium]|nr:hypothetical protein [Armatimonadota bacterium]